jgi:molybdenum cofactor synthesis domain-containing protein
MKLRFGILTASDRSARGERDDLTGPALVELIEGQGWSAVVRAIQPDDLKLLQETMILWSERGDVDIILVAGGTGFAPRDTTPEATLAVIERQAPGLVEAMRSASLQRTPHAMLSRAVAGMRGRTLIIDLPGSPKGAVENLQVVLSVLPHAVELLQEKPEAEAHH